MIVTGIMSVGGVVIPEVVVAEALAENENAIGAKLTRTRKSMFNAFILVKCECLIIIIIMVDSSTASVMMYVMMLEAVRWAKMADKGHGGAGAYSIIIDHRIINIS